MVNLNENILNKLENVVLKFVECINKILTQQDYLSEVNRRDALKELYPSDTRLLSNNLVIQIDKIKQIFMSLNIQEILDKSFKFSYDYMLHNLTMQQGALLEIDMHQAMQKLHLCYQNCRSWNDSINLTNIETNTISFTENLLNIIKSINVETFDFQAQTFNMVAKFIITFKKEDFLKHLLINECNNYFNEIVARKKVSPEIKPSELESFILLLLILTEILEEIVSSGENLTETISLQDFQLTLRNVSKLFPQYVALQINECINLIETINYVRNNGRV